MDRQRSFKTDLSIFNDSDVTTLISQKLFLLYDEELYTRTINKNYIPAFFFMTRAFSSSFFQLNGLCSGVAWNRSFRIIYLGPRRLKAWLVFGESAPFEMRGLDTSRSDAVDGQMKDGKVRVWTRFELCCAFEKSYVIIICS